MKIIVVIGGIGSGKSTVSRALCDLGASCIDLDAVGHDILRNDELKADLAAAFGAEVLGPDGELIRSELARRAFASEEKTALLNSLTHPRIIEEAQARLAEAKALRVPAAVVEISPYDGPEGSFGVFTDMADVVIAVVADVELRVKRAVERGLPEQDVRNRLARQASDEDRRRWATHVLENDATVESLRWDVEELWDREILQIG